MSKKPPLYDMSACLVCRSPNVEWHHVYPSARRKRSDDEGCIAPLCRFHHQGPRGVHQDRKFDLWLKANCQRRWEAREDIDNPEHKEFIALFGRNYL